MWKACAPVNKELARLTYLAINAAVTRRLLVIKTAPVESIPGSRGLEQKKKEREIIVTWGEMNGTKTKQEHEQLLWNP